MITSSQNAKIKYVRSLLSRRRSRRAGNSFVVEGVRLVEEALVAGWGAELVLHTPDLGPRGQAIVDAYTDQGVAVELVSESVMGAVSDTKSPQGLLAVLPERQLPWPQNLDFVFIPDGVRDPGNLGTMLRTAAAAGVQAVFFPPHGADAFAPKVVRAAMGAHFHLPMKTAPWETISANLKATGMRVYLAAAGEGLLYTQADFCCPLALVIGGEAQGAGRDARELAHTCVQIPMPGGMESLNAATAAAILIYEVVRQRVP